MGKVIIVNLSNISFKGDVLDFGGEGAGIVYNLSKRVDNEVAIDIADETNLPSAQAYNTVVSFFLLSKFFSRSEREDIIKEAHRYLNNNGELYIWDINKEKGKIFNNKLRVIVNSETIREFSIKEFNLLKESNLLECKRSLENYFKIVETKKWDDMYFIKAVKKGS